MIKINEFRLEFDGFTLTSADIMPDTKYTHIVNPEGDFVIGIAASAQFTFNINALYETPWIDRIEGSEFNLIVKNAQRGVFIAEKPEVKQGNKINVTALDRMIYFDKLVDVWLDSVVYPITAYNFLQSLCSECGVELWNDEIFNGEFIIPEKPQITQITGRFILHKICEIAACFAVMNEQGELELKWYQHSGVEVHGVFDIVKADYTTPVLEGLQIASAFMTMAIPDSSPTQNVYLAPINPLLLISDEIELFDYGENLFNQIKNNRYIPYKITFPRNTDRTEEIGFITSDGYDFYTSDDLRFITADPGRDIQYIRVGDIITVYSRNNEPFDAWVMSLVMEGTSFHRVTISATGNRIRETKMEAVAQDVQRLNSDFITTITRKAGITVSFEDGSGYSNINPRAWETSLLNANNVLEKVLYIDFLAQPRPKLIFNGDLGVNATGNFYSKGDIDGKFQDISITIGTMSSQFTTDINGIKNNLTLNYSTTTQVGNMITTSAGHLTSTFTNGINGLRSEVVSTYQTMSAAGIESGRLESVFSSGIDGLQYYVQQNYSTTATVDGKIQQTTTTLRSEITATVNGINLAVSNGATSSTLSIRSGSTVLSSANITFSGIVTFQNLQTAGQTIINGSNITTGEITASLIRSGKLYYGTYPIIDASGIEEYPTVNVGGAMGSRPIAGVINVNSNAFAVNSTAIAIGNVALATQIAINGGIIQIGYNGFVNDINLGQTLSRIGFFGAAPYSKQNVNYNSNDIPNSLFRLISVLSVYGLINY